jgi:hypothetical protein
MHQYLHYLRRYPDERSFYLNSNPGTTHVLNSSLLQNESFRRSSLQDTLMFWPCIWNVLLDERSGVLWCFCLLATERLN